MDTAWIALIGTVFGGAGLKLAEGVLAKGASKQDVATSMREELRKDQSTLKDELRTAEKELDNWKMKYYALLEDYLDMKSQVAHAPVKPEKGKEVDW